MTNEALFFIGFIVLIVAVLMVDLLLVGRKTHIVSTKEAAIWSGIWIGLALLFSLFLEMRGDMVHGIENMADLQRVTTLYASHLKLIPDNFEASLQLYRDNMAIAYLTGYLIEKTLSVDNLFVILMILTAFGVRTQHYKPILFWGIMGAIVLRFVFIFVGAALIKKFDWILLIFGGFLVYSAIKMYIDRNKEEKIDPQHHPIVKFLSKYFRVFPKYIGGNFFVKKDARIYITPLFIVLVLIEFSDLIFAFDSIPAIFAVTLDPYVVFFSNIFAILGLRALFFLLIKIVHKFHLLKAGVSILLFYIGLKLLFHHYLDEIGYENMYSLIFISVVLVGSIVLSLVFPKKVHNNEIMN